MGEKSHESGAQAVQWCRGPRNQQLRCIGLRNVGTAHFPALGVQDLQCPRPYPGYVRKGTWLTITKDGLISILSPFCHTQPGPTDCHWSLFSAGPSGSFSPPAHSPLISQEYLSGPANDGQTKMLKV